MKKICTAREAWPPIVGRKLLRVMKLSAFLLLITLFRVSASVYSQNVMLNLDMEDATVGQVLEAIEQKSEFKIAYSSEYVDVDRKVDVHVSGESVETLLKEVFSGTNVDFKLKTAKFYCLKRMWLMHLSNNSVRSPVK